MSDDDAKARAHLEEGRDLILQMITALDAVGPVDPTLVDSCRENISKTMKILSSPYVTSTTKEELGEMNDQLGDLVEMQDDLIKAEEAKKAEEELKELEKKRQEEEDQKRKEEELRDRERQAVKGRMDRLKQKKQEESEIAELKTKLEEVTRNREVQLKQDEDTERDRKKKLDRLEDELSRVSKQLEEKMSKPAPEFEFLKKQIHEEKSKRDELVSAEQAKLEKEKSEQEERLGERMVILNKRKEKQKGLVEMKESYEGQIKEMKDKLDEMRANAATPPSEEMLTERNRVKGLYEKEVAERRKLYNQLADLKGNMRVYVRLRPADGIDDPPPVRPLTDETMAVYVGGKPTQYEFDKIYSPAVTTEEAFEDCAPIVASAVDGNNVLMFAYGQNEAGKSHTLLGTKKDPGVFPRIGAELFKIKEESADQLALEVVAGAVEIKDESIKCALSGSSCSVGDDPKWGKVAQGCKLEEIHTAEDLSKLAFKLTPASGDTHLVMIIQLHTTQLSNKTDLYGKIFCADLAGSNQGAPASVTKVLATLGDCVLKIAMKKKDSPFGSTTMTDLFSDGMGGKAKTMMYANLSPLSKDLEETQNTLAFANRTRGMDPAAPKKGKK